MQRPRRDYFLLLLRISVLLAGLSGIACARGIHVRSKLEFNQLDAPADVVSTPRYKEVIANVERVAVAAPSRCASEGASGRTGAADRNELVLETVCGVEVAEIERALVRANFVVYSWHDVHGLMQSASVSRKEAAKRLGASVLFEVNSLEQVEVEPAERGEWRGCRSRTDGRGSGWSIICMAMTA